MATANPAMNEAVYRRAGRADTPTSVMTIRGSVLKTAILVVILLVTAAYTWTQFAEGATSVAYGLTMLAAGLDFGASQVIGIEREKKYLDIAKKRIAQG